MQIYRNLSMSLAAWLSLTMIQTAQAAPETIVVDQISDITAQDLPCSPSQDAVLFAFVERGMEPNFRLDFCISDQGAELKQMVQKQARGGLNTVYLHYRPVTGFVSLALLEALEDSSQNFRLHLIYNAGTITLDRSSDGKLSLNILTTLGQTTTYIGALEVTDSLFHFDTTSSCRPPAKPWQKSFRTTIPSGQRTIELTLKGCETFEFGTNKQVLLSGTVADSSQPQSVEVAAPNLAARTTHHNVCVSYRVETADYIYGLTLKGRAGNMGSQLDECFGLLPETPNTRSSELQILDKTNPTRPPILVSMDSKSRDDSLNRIDLSPVICPDQSKLVIFHDDRIDPSKTPSTVIEYRSLTNLFETPIEYYIGFDQQHELSFCQSQQSMLTFMRFIKIDRSIQKSPVVTVIDAMSDSHAIAGDPVTVKHLIRPKSAIDAKGLYEIVSGSFHEFSIEFKDLELDEELGPQTWYIMYDQEKNGLSFFDSNFDDPVGYPVSLIQHKQSILQ